MPNDFRHTEYRCWKISFKSEVSHSSQQEDQSYTSKNLDFKIASGLREIPTGNFKKQVTTAEGKAPSEKRSLTGRQIACVIFSYLTKVQFKNDNVQTFDTKWDEAPSAVIRRLRDSTLESLQV